MPGLGKSGTSRISDFRLSIRPRFENRNSAGARLPARRRRGRRRSAGLCAAPRPGQKVYRAARRRIPPRAHRPDCARSRSHPARPPRAVRSRDNRRLARAHARGRAVRFGGGGTWKNENSMMKMLQNGERTLSIFGCGGSSHPRPETQPSGAWKCATSFAFGDGDIDANRHLPRLRLGMARISMRRAAANGFSPNTVHLYQLRAWVLMVNHVHILIYPEARLSRITKAIKNHSARQANAIFAHHGAHTLAVLARRIVRSLGAGAGRVGQDRSLY